MVVCDSLDFAELGDGFHGEVLQGLVQVNTAGYTVVLWVLLCTQVEKRLLEPAQGGRDVLDCTCHIVGRLNDDDDDGAVLNNKQLARHLRRSVGAWPQHDARDLIGRMQRGAARSVDTRRRLPVKKACLPSTTSLLRCSANTRCIEDSIGICPSDNVWYLAAVSWWVRITATPA